MGKWEIRSSALGRLRVVGIYGGDSWGRCVRLPRSSVGWALLERVGSGTLAAVAAAAAAASSLFVRSDRVWSMGPHGWPLLRGTGGSCSP